MCFIVTNSNNVQNQLALFENLTHKVSLSYHRFAFSCNVEQTWIRVLKICVP